MANILITGGAGYIGSHLIKTLESFNHNIIVIDNLSNSYESSIQSAKLIINDIGDTHFLDTLMSEHKFDMCIHLAGSLSVEESFVNPQKYFQNNTQNSIGLISLCLKHKINKFIFSSSSTVYGNSCSGINSEDDPLSPINNYGKSKKLIEDELKNVQNLNPDFSFLALRYFNVSGADLEVNLGQNGKSSYHLIKVACEVATGKRDFININGHNYNTSDGTCIRDYVHIKDITKAHLLAIEYLIKNSQSHFLNIGSGQGYSVLEIIKKLEVISKRNIPTKLIPAREGDADISVANISSIKKVLNWEPEYSSIEVIIESAYQWESRQNSPK